MSVRSLIRSLLCSGVYIYIYIFFPSEHNWVFVTAQREPEQARVADESAHCSVIHRRLALALIFAVVSLWTCASRRRPKAEGREGTGTDSVFDSLSQPEARC